MKSNLYALSAWFRRTRFAGLLRIAACLLAFATASSHAVDNTSLAMTPVQWQDLHQNSPQQDIVGLGADLFGDKVDLFSGSVSFTQTDVSLTGNDRLDVSVGRSYRTGRREVNRHFGDWDLEIPHLAGYFPRSAGWTGVNNPAGAGQQTADPLARCTKFGIPFNLGSVSGMTYSRTDYWQGNNLHLPGVGRQEILSRKQFVPYTGYVAGPNTTQPTDGNTYPLVTKGNWQIRCLTSLARGAGEGFLAVSPEGIQYRFDWMVARDITPLKVGANYESLDEVWIMPTQVRDRFGNTVTYTYDSVDPWRLLQISASDGRLLNINYRTDGRISTVSDGTRTWTYNYAGDGSLASVVQPDNASWTFSIRAFADPGVFKPAQDCSAGSVPPQGARVGTITHPSGAVGTFTAQYVMRNRRGFLMACDSSSGDPNLPVLAYRALGWSPLALQTKVLTGPGIETQQWSYTYGTNGNDDAVNVSSPDGSATRYTFGNYYNVDNGLLKRVDEGWNGTAALRTTVNTYASPQGRAYPEPVGYSDQPNDPIEIGHRPLLRREITQQGVAMILQADAFDGFARTTALTRSSTLGTSRSESTQFYDHLGLWVLGQVKVQNAAGIEANRIDFDTSNALPLAYYYFGALKNRYTFRADGTLSSVSDGLNQATTFANYKRGVPQNVGYADGRSMSALVDNIGNLTSVTNEANATWTYGYDAMGRIARKTPPASGYNPTTLSFVQVPNDEYGIGANHWRQTVTTGNAVAINYFDARWRKRLMVSYDAANTAATTRMQRFDYDAYNRTTFAAYHARSIASITSTTPGTATTYDALGRVIKTVSSSELGALTTTTDYLDAFQKRYTDAKGNKTTTSYQVFDEPNEGYIATVAAPEGLTVTISRDAFSKPTSIARSGTYGGSAVSATRRYVYDGNQRLCKTIDPETGATIQSLDAANNVTWRATGLNLLSTTSCDQANVPASTKIAYVYDARNRVTGTGFADGSASIGRSYTEDGLPLTVVSGGSTWTYGYNNLRLLTSETLSFGGLDYVIGRTYDANANLSLLTYPGVVGTVDFLPNALGEPTKAGSFASSVTYHPNGMVAGYTLGNGTVHSLTQNTRGLPLVNKDAGVLQDQYAYDANANIAGITDQQEGISTRTMAYDGLDRLTQANAPAVWGAGSYIYDPLGNMRVSVVGARNSIHTYDTSNRLILISSTNGSNIGFAYDSQGNVTGRGTQGYYFDQGNRMQLANGKASYTYDGLGRRVSVNANDGTSRVQVYSQAGQILYGTQQSSGNAQSIAYIYLGGKAIAQKSSANADPTYLYTDTLGSPVATSGTVPASISYSCPAGWSLSGNTCSQGTTTTIAATISGYTCPSGYTLSGSTCSQSTTSTSAATPNYSCPTGYSLSNGSCVQSVSTPATPVYACPSGFTLSGTTCNGTSVTAASRTWDCAGQGSLQPLSISPSGYYCTSRTISVEASDACPDLTPSGLVFVGYRATTKTIGTCYFGPRAVYSCPAGATLAGTNCNTPVSQAASLSYYTCPSGSLSGSTCITTNTTAVNVSYSCPAGQTLSGTTCSTSSVSTVAGTAVYSCPSGYALSGSSCSMSGTTTQAATASYVCSSGTVSGSSCLGALTRTRYEAYGNTAAGTVPTGLGFTGHVNDADTGLVYMQQRYYDPIAARFLSVDPIVTDANTGKGFNLYEYVNSNPYKYTDPDGRDAWYKEPQMEKSSAPVFTLPGKTITAPRFTTPAFPAAGSGTLILRGGVGLGLLTYSKPLGAPSEMCGTLACGTVINAQPPEDARDPNGPKAPGKPGEDEGFKDPKGGEDWVKNPNGRGYGWRDSKGNVWVPTGPGGGAHGGPHWDVQFPGGGYVNVYPGGAQR